MILFNWSPFWNGIDGMPDEMEDEWLRVVTTVAQ